MRLRLFCRSCSSSSWKRNRRRRQSLHNWRFLTFLGSFFAGVAPAHRGGGTGGGGGVGNRYSYHENPAHRYDGHDFSSLPRDHRFLSWKRDLRPPPAIRSDMGGHEAIRGHRRSFHYDDRKEAYLNPAGHAAGVPIRPGGQREISPAAARRSYDCSNIHPTFIEPCDR